MKTLTLNSSFHDSEIEPVAVQITREEVNYLFGVFMELPANHKVITTVVYPKGGKFTSETIEYLLEELQNGKQNKNQ